MEYMVVVGFTLLMLLPVIAIYGIERQSMREQVNIKQAQNIARKIVDASETTYYLGKPAQTTIKVYMPPGVRSVTFTNREVLFIMDVGSKTTEVPPPVSSINMSGNLSINPGLQYILITADDYQVNISNKEV